MQKIVVFIIIVSVLIASFSKLLILANYAINKVEITQKFCENKFNTQKKCFGKCHVNKLLVKDDKASSSSNSQSKETFEITLISLQEKSRCAIVLRPEAIYWLPYKDDLCGELYSQCFHPPC